MVRKAHVRPPLSGKVSPYSLTEIINLPAHSRLYNKLNDPKRFYEEFAEMNQIFQFQQRPTFLKLTKDGKQVAWDVELPEDRFVVIGSVVEPRVKEGWLKLYIRRRFEQAMLLDFQAQYVYYVETVNGTVLDPYLQTLQQAKDVVLQIFEHVKWIDALDNPLFKAKRMTFGLRATTFMAAFVELSDSDILVISKHKPMQIETITNAWHEAKIAQASRSLPSL
jgi:hypothetical protein